MVNYCWCKNNFGYNKCTHLFFALFVFAILLGNPRMKFSYQCCQRRQSICKTTVAAMFCPLLGSWSERF